MLNDGPGFKKVYLATGFTDLRRGIDGLDRIIRFQFQLDPYDKNTLFYYNIFMDNPLTSSKELSILLLKLLECR